MKMNMANMKLLRLGTQCNLYSIGSHWGFALGVTCILCFALGVTQILAYANMLIKILLELKKKVLCF